MYSAEEIERKRQLALQKKKEKEKSFNNSSNLGPSTTPKNVNNNQNKNVTHNAGNQSIQKYFNNFPSQSTKSNVFGYQSNESFKNKSDSSLKKLGSQNRYNPMQKSAQKFYGSQSSQPVCEVICSMISNERFAADITLFNSHLIDLFKTIPTRIYDINTKVWNFHLKDYSLLRDKIRDLKSENIAFKAIPNMVLKVFENLMQEEKADKKHIDISSIDDTLIKSLYPFQKEGIEYGISKNGKCLIADDMGLGKTRQALGIACYYKKNWPLIIITPSSVRYQWSEAVIEHLPSVPVQSIQHIISTKDYIERSQITIVSYDLLTRRIDELSAQKFGVIICDESHYLKSSKTQRTKAVQKLSVKANNIILLTGTPALSRPIELHPQIKLLLPNFMNYTEFGMRYCAGVQTNFGLNCSGSSNLKELELLLRASCLIRRLKSDVMTQLPSKIRQKIILDPNTIKASTKEMQAASENMEKKSLSGIQKHSALLEYYSESSKAKEKAVCHYIADLIENEQKFLVFAHHQNMLDAISQLLISKKIMFIRIDGKTNPEQRKHYVDSFQKDEKILVAVLSIMAANAGITLTASSLVIFAELSWNPGILCQAEDRVHRIGQTDSVVIRYLLAKGTADDYLWPAIQKKIDVLNEVGLDQNFDLNQADVSNQSLIHQKKIDDFMDTSSPSTSMNVSGNADLHASSENLKDLLNDDDDVFDSIDLDNIS